MSRGDDSPRYSSCTSTHNAFELDRVERFGANARAVPGDFNASQFVDSEAQDTSSLLDGALTRPGGRQLGPLVPPRAHGLLPGMGPPKGSAPGSARRR